MQSEISREIWKWKLQMHSPYQWIKHPGKSNNNRHANQQTLIWSNIMKSILIKLITRYSNYGWVEICFLIFFHLIKLAECLRFQNKSIKEIRIHLNFQVIVAQHDYLNHKKSQRHHLKKTKTKCLWILTWSKIML